MDDVVDLSMAPSSTAPSVEISQETVRDLQTLTQTSGLTITRAPVPPVNLSAAAGTITATDGVQITDNGGASVGAQDNGKYHKIFNLISQQSDGSLIRENLTSF